MDQDTLSSPEKLLPGESFQYGRKRDVILGLPSAFHLRTVLSG